jgi:hypothetical protein
LDQCHPLSRYPRKITPENTLRHYSNARKHLRWFKIELVAFLRYLEWNFIQEALGNGQNTGLGFALRLFAEQNNNRTGTKKMIG